MDPFVFDVLHRERLRAQVADLCVQRLRDQENKAPGRSRGTVRVLFGRVRTRIAHLLGSGIDERASDQRAPVETVSQGRNHRWDEWTKLNVKP